jgi:hypothetical protein
MQVNKAPSALAFQLECLLNQVPYLFDYSLQQDQNQDAPLPPGVRYVIAVNNLGAVWTKVSI